MQLTVDATRRDARDLPHPPARAGRRRPAISSCSIRSGFRAVTARATTSRTSPASGPRANGQRAQVGARHARRLRLPHRRAGGRHRDRRRLPVSSRRPPTTRAGRWRRPTWRASSGCRNSMYPAGYYVRQIPVQASVIVPTGWKVATALRPSGQTGNRDRLSGDQLRDPGGFAADRRRALSPDPADAATSRSTSSPTRPAELAATPEQIAAHKRLVDQAVKAFGAQHYDHYDFLLTISDNLGGNGLEHHRSSEDGVEPRLFHRLGQQAARPQPAAARIYATAGTASSAAGADLWTPDYRTADGRTACCGSMKARRNSGAMCSAPARGCCRSRTRSTRSPRPRPPTAPARPGRAWRPLVDTTNDPIIAGRAAAAVAQLAAQRGLLQRRPADLARRRPDHPPAVGRQALDRRFRQAPSSACATATRASSPTRSTTSSRR